MWTSVITDATAPNGEDSSVITILHEYTPNISRPLMTDYLEFVSLHQAVVIRARFYQTRLANLPVLD